MLAFPARGLETVGKCSPTNSGTLRDFAMEEWNIPWKLHPSRVFLAPWSI